MKKTISLIAVALLGLALSGCGGGSSTPSYTVSTSDGTGGTISPTSATVNDGSTTSFTVTPNTGYGISGVSGCGGTLSGTTYTTGAVTADCTVTASFALQYTWMSGSDTVNAIGVYGNQGTPAAGNAPGARVFATTWTDASGNLWLFGGLGNDSVGSYGNLNDQWKYDPSSDQWTWVSGSDTTNASGVYNTPGSNVPGARQGAIGWADASGNLWLFGGNGYDSTGATGYLNDLWKYNIASGQWTWVGGSNTTNSSGTYGALSSPSSSYVPSAREWGVGWTDASGNLWLLGGLGYDATGTSNRELNDLWEYNPSSGEWTWMSGSATGNASGVYNFPGENAPGARESAVGWTDASGNLWLLGGWGCDSAGTNDELNDLWKYDIASNTWTWMSGSDIVDASGVYGIQGTPAAGNAPGAVSGAATWTDASGNLWLFGGFGYDSAGTQDDLNALWKYDPSSGQWTWMAGSDTVDASGVYGTQGTPATTNIPGARDGAVSWTDTSGTFWLFGGQGYDSASNWGVLNDLWSFHP